MSAVPLRTDREQRTLRHRVIATFNDLLHPVETYRRRLNKTQTVEAIDFEEPDGDSMRIQFRTRKWDRLLADLCVYGMSAVVAVIVGGVYLFVYLGIEVFSDWHNQLLKYFVLERKEHLTGWAISLVICSTFCISGAIFAFIEPSAAVSGLPEVISYLNGIDLRKHATFRALLFKILSLICIVSSSLFSGYDGPMAQIGLIVAILVVETVAKSSVLSRYFFGNVEEPLLENSADTRNILNVLYRKKAMVFSASGASAGISCALHSPMGATVFALEEAVSFFNASLILRTLFISLLAYFVVGFIGNSKLTGSSFLPSDYALFPVDYMCQKSVAFVDIISFVALGFIAGIFGGMYNKIVKYLLILKKRYLFDYPMRRLAEVIFLAVLTTSALVYLPTLDQFQKCTPAMQMFGHISDIQTDCIVTCNNNRTHPCFNTDSVCLPKQAMFMYDRQVQKSLEDARRICNVDSNFNETAIDVNKLSRDFGLPYSLATNPDKTCYYQLPSLFYNSPTKVLKNLLMQGVHEMFDAEVLAVYAGVYLILSVLTYHILMPTDLVLPNLIFGATIGRLFGILVNVIKTNTGVPGIDPGSYALLGAAAFWSGTSRIMLTIAVVTVESTLDLNYLIGVIISVLIATIVGNWFGPSLYHEEILVQNLPFLPEESPPAVRELRVMDIMKTNPTVLYETQTAKEIFGKLANCPHQGFPIVKPESSSKEDGLLCKNKIMGIVLRSQLRDKLKVTVRVSEQDEQIIDGTLTVEEAQKVLQALRKAEDRNLKIDVELTPIGSASSDKLETAELEHDETLIDLTKIMSHPPHVVHETMSVSKAYSMFRQLGLRHLCVVDGNFYLVGILTRKDFLRAFHIESHHTE